jgi:predicted GIY-YIG superfamily endonuclease
MSIKITLPTSFVETTPVDVKNKKEFDRSGVYVFYDDSDTPLYVGKSISFKRRFGGHAKTSKFFRLSTKVRLYYVDNEFEKDIYETFLIKELKPEFNRDKSYYTRLEYEDMLQKVEETIIDIKLELSDLRDSHEDDDESDYCYDDDHNQLSAELGEFLFRSERAAELDYRLKKLYIRKATLLGRLSR